MMELKQWFFGLPKREQYLLMFAAAVLSVYLVYILGYKKLQVEKERYQRMNQSSEQTLSYLRDAVAEIETLRRSGSAPSDASNRSLAQIAEQAAGRAGLRINRFAPSGDNEAQVWFERVEFDKFLNCLSALELDYGVNVDNLAVNAVNAPGIVNVRFKITR